MKLVGISYMSPSQASTLTLCERKWWHKYVEGLTEPSSEPLAMGGGLAEAHEFGIEAGITEYHKRRPEADPLFDDPDARLRDGVAGEAIIRAAFAGYTARYLQQDTEANLVREIPYLVAIPGSTRFLQCRVDGVADTYLVEDKLRAGGSLREADLTNERTQGRQLTAEIYCRWRASGELLPIYLRCMKKPDPRKVKAAWAEGGVDAVIAHVDEHFAQDSSFIQLRADRTVEQLERFEEEMRDMCRRVDELDHDGEPRGQRNQDACHSYGRPCPALAQCQGVGE